MSLPLHACTIMAAIKGDEKAKEMLIARLDQPAFTFYPCKHVPRCKRPDELTAGAFLSALAESHPQTLNKLLNLAQL